MLSGLFLCRFGRGFRPPWHMVRPLSLVCHSFSFRQWHCGSRFWRSIFKNTFCLCPFSEVRLVWVRTSPKWWMPPFLEILFFEPTFFHFGDLWHEICFLTCNLHSCSDGICRWQRFCAVNRLFSLFLLIRWLSQYFNHHQTECFVYSESRFWRLSFLSE